MNREQGKNLINVSYDSKKILIAIQKQINHGRYKSDKLNIDKSFRKIL